MAATDRADDTDRPDGAVLATYFPDDPDFRAESEPRTLPASWRAARFDQAKGALDCDSDAEVIDAALRHAVESVENFEDVKREVSPELAERLSTDEGRLTQYPQVRVD